VKLLHLANFGSMNVGNGALIDGTERVIREDFPEPVEFVHEPWDEYFIEGVAGPRKFDQTFVDKVNACDALIVGGAVMFREDHIRFKMPPGIKKPIVFYGVSYRVWGDGSYYTGTGFMLDITAILTYPRVIFGVRNDGTEKWLWEKMGLHHSATINIPDPGLYVETVERKPWQIEDGKINIAVVLNGEDESKRFGAKLLIVLGNIAKALTMFWEQDRNVNILLCTHTHDDHVLVKELIKFLPVEMVYQNVVCPGLHRATQALFFYDIYRYADLVLAMRIHAMVPAIGLATPMLALSTQKRMDVFMGDAKLGYYLMNLFDVTPGQLYGKMEACLKYPSNVKTDFYKAKDEMRKKTKVFNEKIYHFIKEG